MATSVVVFGIQKLLFLFFIKTLIFQNEKNLLLPLHQFIRINPGFGPAK